MRTFHVSKRLVVGALIFTMLSPFLLFAQVEMPITTSSKEARDLFVKGRDQFENVNFVRATQLFDQAIAKDADFALAHLYRFSVGGGPSVTRPHLEKAVSLANAVSAGEREFILAMKSNSDGDRSGYKQHLDALMKLHPNDKRSYFYMGFYYNAQDDAEALKLFKKAADMDKNFAAVYNYIGYVHIRAKNNTEAEKALQQYIAAAPHLSNPRDSYAELLLRMGRFDESIVQYKKANELDPTFTGALGGVGFNYIHKGDFQKARESFEAQFQKSTQSAGKLAALANIIFSYLHQWNVDEAVKATDRYRAFAEKENLDQGKVTYHGYLGWMMLETGKLTEARKHFEGWKAANDVSKLSAGTKGANELNSSIAISYVAMRSKDFAGAKKQLEACEALQKKRSIATEGQFLHTAWGNLQREQGNYDEALNHFAMGGVNAPFNMFFAGLAYEQKGDKENAKKMFTQIVNYNWTGFPYALVRARAKKNLGM